MQKRTRRVLFWVAFIIFVAASYTAVRYAQGEVFDWTTRSFVRTGAIAVTVNTDATLYVNDRLAGDTSLLRKRIGAERLAPGQYTIRVIRDEYSVWRKTADVSAGLLTEFPSVMLLPTDEDSLLQLRAEASTSLTESMTLARSTPLLSPKPSPLPKPSVNDRGFTLTGTTLRDTSTASPSLVAEAVLGFTVSQDGSRILWWTRNEIWVRWLRNTDYQPFLSEGHEQLITRFSAPIRAASWFRGRDHIVVDVGSSGYRVIEVDTRGGINIIRL
jgi:hypothetical protein